MKFILCFLILFQIAACNQNSKEESLQRKIDTLQQKLSATYSPGLGEFMSNIQVHHAKLWFAGTNQNWPLADFEIHEIMETLDNIQKFNSDRPEVKAISMINAPIDSLNAAIAQKNIGQFKSSFAFLTNTCNSCHQATQHGFNVIKIPGSPPFSNQEYK
jgi:hypothetical protein